MKRLSSEKEDKESLEENYVPRHTAQVVTISSVDDGILNESHRPMIFMFSPQCEGPMSYQTMLGDEVVHADQNSSKSERANMNGTVLVTGYWTLILKAIRPCTSVRVWLKVWLHETSHSP